MKNFMAFEFKVHKAESNGDVGYIEGYASTFGNVDQGLDVVDRGAFSKTIKDKNGVFPILIDHDPSKPFGWNLSASEDDYGLKVKGEVNLITEEQKNRYALSKRALDLGTKCGLSIGYSTIKSEPDTEQPQVRHLKELKLWEYSHVTFPMNTMASVTAAKFAHLGNDKLEKLLALFETLQKSDYDLDGLKKALETLGNDHSKSPAAKTQTDPALLQSVDNMIRTLRA